MQSPTWYAVTFVSLHAGLTAALCVRSTWRRGSFVATYALLAAMAGLMGLAPINLGVSPLILCAPLSLYKVARHDPASWSSAALLLGIAGSFVSPLEHLPGGKTGAMVPLLILGMVGTHLWATGLRRTALAHARDLRRAADEHHREADRRVHQAQTDERVRLAREIHDIVAHSLAVVNVQAATALAIGTEEQMRESLIGVKESSKHALTEIRSLVEVLRDEDPGMEVSGDLQRLISLADEARAAGLRLEEDLDPASLAEWQHRWPAAARLAVVRVVQEGLSNVLKHGGPSPVARLSVAEDGDVCRLDLANDALHQGDSSGFGLVGLAERVGLVGGTLEAGPVAAGFTLRATIPVGGDAPRHGSRAGARA